MQPELLDKLLDEIEVSLVSTKLVCTLYCIVFPLGGITRLCETAAPAPKKQANRPFTAS